VQAVLPHREFTACQEFARSQNFKSKNSLYLFHLTGRPADAFRIKELPPTTTMKIKSIKKKCKIFLHCKISLHSSLGHIANTGGYKQGKRASQGQYFGLLV